MEDIENYEKFSGLKKQLDNVATQIYMMNQISARQNKAITALIKLQSYGVTDEEILNVHKFLEGARQQGDQEITGMIR